MSVCVCVCVWCCAGVETFRQQLDLGMAGDQLGVLVRGVKREDVKRGMVLCPPGTVTSNTQIKAQVTADIHVRVHHHSFH